MATASFLEDEFAAEEAVEPSAAEKLMALASKTGNFADAIDKADLAKLGLQCVEDYERDKRDRKEWEDIAKVALESTKQKKRSDVKDSPWPRASNIRFPLLTPAVLQFWARMLPAVIKGDEAVLCKVIGQDVGKPEMGPDGQPMAVAPDGGPITAQQAMQMPPETQQQLQPMWRVPPGAKAKRARRVSEYLNTVLFYRMEDWESDTSALLMQLPAAGCVFRKLWYDSQAQEPKAAMVSALRVFVPKGARSLDTTPRVTEEVPDVYPHQITEGVRSGRYLDVDILQPKEAEGDDARLLLEQHRLIDMDDDGFEEPYIVIVDHESAKILRIEANFGPDDVKLNEAGEVMKIKRGKFYVKHGLFPDPEGGYYDLGLGHLLEQCGDVVDTAINQLTDAGHAQTAGGGFIGSGVRLQSRGGGSKISYEPGVYRTVDVPGDVLKNAIVERTLPNVSPVTFQVLDLILGVAKDISGSTEVLTGEASNNGQVGTTLALIEQGLQVFNATAKMEFLALKGEYNLLAENIRKYGGEAAAKDYLEVLDDPEADFEADFNSSDVDIRPVSDPSTVTRMQKLAKAQFILGTFEQLVAVGGDPREAMKRVYEAADIEDIDKLLPAPKPPDPMQQAAVQAEMEAKGAAAQRDMSSAALNTAKIDEGAAKLQIEQAKVQIEAFKAGTAAQSGAQA